MSLSKSAKTDHPIHELLSDRWSPTAFSSRPVPDEDLRSLFEAARWTASSYQRATVALRRGDPGGPRGLRAAALLSC